MKVGDVKIEALRLMFAGVPARMTAENVSSYEYSADYGDYLSMMPGSINRCLSDITSRKILPERRKELDFSKAEKKLNTYRFDLSTESDFYDVSRVIMQTECAYEGDYPFRMEGKTLVLLAPDEAASFTLLYHPRAARVESYENTRELSEIPDEIAVLIPYFIKGEVFREDEAGEAAEAMSWYEQALSSLGENRTEKQGSVVSVYAQEVL